MKQDIKNIEDYIVNNIIDYISNYNGNQSIYSLEIISYNKLKDQYVYTYNDTEYNISSRLLYKK